MGKRLKFRCWKCGKTYKLYREYEMGQKLRVACPYCHEEGVVELEPNRKKKTTPIFRGGNSERDEAGEEYELVLPEELPTRPPDEEA